MQSQDAAQKTGENQKKATEENKDKANQDQ
jgi:hypothetical protein